MYAIGVQIVVGIYLLIVGGIVVYGRFQGEMTKLTAFTAISWTGILLYHLLSPRQEPLTPQPPIRKTVNVLRTVIEH